MSADRGMPHVRHRSRLTNDGPRFPLVNHHRTVVGRRWLAVRARLMGRR